MKLIKADCVFSCWYCGRRVNGRTMPDRISSFMTAILSNPKNYRLYEEPQENYAMINGKKYKLTEVTE